MRDGVDGFGQILTYCYFLFMMVCGATDTTVLHYGASTWDYYENVGIPIFYVGNP